MLASSLLVASGLAAVAQGALMPRQSNIGTPGCLRCPTATLGVSVQAEGNIQSNHDLLCSYYDSTGRDHFNCVFDGTTGAMIAPSDPLCSNAVTAPAAPAVFQCPAAVDQWALLYFELDSAGNTACFYGPSTADPIQDTCQYDPTGALEAGASGVDCAEAPPRCGSTSRRAYKGDKNLAVVKRRQAARAAPPVVFPSRRLVLKSKEQA